VKGDSGKIILLNKTN